MHKSVFSVDVEEWFHILDVPSTPALAEWGAQESRVEKSFRSMLEVFAEKNVRTTLFFLAWVVERYPHLVREAVAGGHEIASHGYAHELVYRQDRRTFTADIKKAKDIIEQAAGSAVRGYRAPGFSVTKETPWFYDAVAEAGYTGVVEVEIFNEDIWAMPHAEVVDTVKARYAELVAPHLAVARV